MTNFTPKDFQDSVQRIGKSMMAPASLANKKLIDSYTDAAQAQVAAATEAARKLADRAGLMLSATTPEAFFKQAESLGQDLAEAQKQALAQVGSVTDRQLSDFFAVADQSVESGTDVLRESLDVTTRVAEATIGAAFQGAEKFQAATAKAA